MMAGFTEYKYIYVQQTGEFPALLYYTATLNYCSITHKFCYTENDLDSGYILSQFVCQQQNFVCR